MRTMGPYGTIAEEMQIRPASNRCLFSLLPPWLVPQSFGKVAVGSPSHHGDMIDHDRLTSRTRHTSTDGVIGGDIKDSRKIVESNRIDKNGIPPAIRVWYGVKFETK